MMIESRHKGIESFFNQKKRINSTSGVILNNSLEVAIRKLYSYGYSMDFIKRKMSTNGVDVTRKEIKNAIIRSKGKIYLRQDDVIKKINIANAIKQKNDSKTLPTSFIVHNNVGEEIILKKMPYSNIRIYRVPFFYIRNCYDKLLSGEKKTLELPVNIVNAKKFITNDFSFRILKKIIIIDKDKKPKTFKHISTEIVKINNKNFFVLTITDDYATE